MHFYSYMILVSVLQDENYLKNNNQIKKKVHILLHL